MELPEKVTKHNSKEREKLSLYESIIPEVVSPIVPGSIPPLNSSVKLPIDVQHSDLSIKSNDKQSIANTLVTTGDMQAEQVSIRRVQANVYTNSAVALNQISPLVAASLQSVVELPALPSTKPLLSTVTADIKNLSAEEIIANVVIEENSTGAEVTSDQNVKPKVINQQVQINAGIAYVPAAKVVTEQIKLVADNEQVRTPNQLRQRLRHEYQKNNFIPRICYPNDPLPIEQLYVRLLLVSDEENQLKKEQGFKQDDLPQREDYLNTFESIHSAKSPIEIDSLYRVSLLPRKTFRYFIEGRAGIGKTTFLKYIIYRWSLPLTDKQQLWNEQFDWIFAIKLRNLDGYAATTMNDEELLLAIIERECLNLGPMESLSSTERQLLKQVLRTEKILWCLDGYDEFNPTNDKRLQQFLNVLLNSTHVILTSRPHQFKSTIAMTHLEITGFNLAAMHAYIDKTYAHIKDISLGRIRHLKDLISQDQNLQGIMHVPINFELLCSLWHQKQLDLKNFTITELYKNIVDLLIIRYLEKNQNNIELCDAMITFLEALAFIGMLDYRVMLTMNDIEKALARVPLKLNKHQVLQELKRIGLIKSTDNGLHFYFLHLTIQEYLAAGYLRNLLSDEISGKSLNTSLIKPTEFISKQKYNSRYQVMWWFLAGRLVQPDMINNLPLQCYFDILCQAPFTLPGVHQLNLIVRCLNEANLSQAISQKELILKYYAESLRKLINGSYLPWGHLSDNKPQLKKDNVWLEYFLDILLTCPRIALTSEMEEMFIDDGVNLEHLRRIDILSQRVMENVLKKTHRLSIRGIGLLKQPKIRNELLIKYQLTEVEGANAISLVFKVTVYDRYNHFLHFGCFLLCKHINKNPNVILFLLESAENFEEKIRDMLFNILDTINQYDAYTCEDYDVKLLIKLARIIHGLKENAIKLNIFNLWESVIKRQPINPVFVNILFKNVNTTRSVLEIIASIGKEAKTTEMVEEFISEIEKIDLMDFGLETIKILFIWEIYDNFVILKFAEFLKTQYWKDKQVKSLVIHLVDLHITELSLRDVLMNFLDKMHDWYDCKNTCLMLVDYLYGVLTPIDQKIELLEKLAKSHIEYIATLAKHNLSVSATDNKMLLHNEDSYEYISSSSKSDYVREVMNKFLTENNTQLLVEYFNTNTRLAYIENSHLCYLLNKELKRILLTEEQEKLLVKAFAESSLLPLFITTSDASRYEVNHLMGDKWLLGKIDEYTQVSRNLPLLQAGQAWKNNEFVSGFTEAQVIQQVNEDKTDKPTIKNCINQLLFSSEQQISKEKERDDKKSNSGTNNIGIQWDRNTR